MDDYLDLEELGEKFEHPSDAVKITVNTFQETEGKQDFIEVDSELSTPLFSLPPSPSTSLSTFPSPMALTTPTQSPPAFELISDMGLPVDRDPEPAAEPADPAAESTAESAEHMESKFEELRGRYQFRQTPARMKAQRHPPDISGNDLKGVCGLANMGNTC